MRAASTTVCSRPGPCSARGRTSTGTRWQALSLRGCVQRGPGESRASVEATHGSFSVQGIPEWPELGCPSSSAMLSLSHLVLHFRSSMTQPMFPHSDYFTMCLQPYPIPSLPLTRLPTLVSSFRLPPFHQPPSLAFHRQTAAASVTAACTSYRPTSSRSLVAWAAGCRCGRLGRTSVAGMHPLVVVFALGLSNFTLTHFTLELPTTW